MLEIIMIVGVVLVCGEIARKIIIKIERKQSIARSWKWLDNYKSENK